MEKLYDEEDEEYAPIYDDYVESERGSKPASHDDVNADSNVRNQRNKSKRQSRYNDEGYTLPDYEEGSSSSSSVRASFQQANISVYGLERCKKSFHCLTWKTGMIFLTMAGILVGSGVAVYLFMPYKGKGIVVSI